MELRGDDDLIADRCQRPADQSLILACGVTFSGVVKGAAQVERLAHQIDRLVLVRRRPVSVTEPHRAQTDRRDFQIATSEFTFLHRYLPSMLSLTSQGTLILLSPCEQSVCCRVPRQ